MAFHLKNQAITTITNRIGHYIVTERGCLKNHTGANKHIKVGLHYLNKYYKVSLHSPSTSERSLVGMEKFSFPSFLYFFFKLLIAFPSQFFYLKKRRPSFVYERYNLLNFNILIICKVLNILHFYEINGLWKEQHQNGLLSYLESKLLSYSNFCFCFGLRGNLIPFTRHTNLENGVSYSFWKAFKNHRKYRSIDLNLCFLGTPMKHHNIGLIFKSISILPKSIRSSIQLHFIGTLSNEINKHREAITIPLIFHGPKSKKARINLLKKMHCGLISGGSPFASFMKLYEYGSAKCAVVAPRSLNLSYWFEENNLFFYNSGDPYSLARTITEIYFTPIQSAIKSNHLFQTIGKRFLWSNTFSCISKIIERHL